MPRIKSKEFQLNNPSDADQKPMKKLSNSKYPVLLIKIFDNAIAISLFLLFFGLPLFLTNSTLQGIGFEKQVFFYVILGFGVLLWILKSVCDNKIIFKKTPLDIPIILFLAIIFISSSFSIDKWASFAGAYEVITKNFFAIIAMAVFYWFLVSNIDKKKLNFILSGMVLSYAVIIIIAFLNFFSVNLFGKFSPEWFKIIVNNAGFNTIGLLSNLQIFFSMIIFVFIGLANSRNLGVKENSKPEIWKVIKRISCILIFAGTLVCLSLLVLSKFNSLAGFLMGLTLLLLLSVFQFINIDKKIFGGISFLFALAILYLLLGRPVLHFREFNGEASLSNKVCWEITKSTLREKPFLGVGFGNFEYAFNNYRPKELNENELVQNTRFLEASGILNEIMITSGIAGIVSLFVLILTFLGIVFSSFRSGFFSKREEWDDQKLLIAGLLAGCISIGADMVLALTGTALILYLIIIASLVIAVISLNKPEKFKDIEISYKVKPQYGLVLLFALIFSGCLIVFVFISVGKIYFADSYAYQAFVAGNNENAAILWEKAVKLNPRQYFYYQKIGDIEAAQGIKELNNSNKKGAEELFKKALDSYKTATLILPKNAYVWESFGAFSESLAQYDAALLLEAENAYKKAGELNPFSSNLSVRLAIIKEKIADSLDDKELENKKKIYNEAIESLVKATQLKNNFVDAYGLKGRIEEKLGKWDDAIKSITESYELNANNQFYSFNLGRLYYNRAVNKDLSTSTAAVIDGNENDFVIAENLFKRAIELKPDYSDAIYSLAVLYEHLGNKEDARKYYQQVFDLLPESEKEAKDMVKKKLESL